MYVAKKKKFFESYFKIHKSCDLYLEPAANVSSIQPDDCSCYTEVECSGIWFYWKDKWNHILES